MIVSQTGTELNALPDFDTLWNFSDPKATGQKFRELLETARTSGNTSYHAELLTQIARTESLQAGFEEAHRLLDSAELLIGPDRSRAQIRYLLERGRTYNSSGDKPKARELFRQAWDLARELKEDYYAVDAAHMMAIAEETEKQLEWNQAAMKAAEESSDPRAKRWLGALYNNMGWTYHDMKEYSTALELFTKSLDWRIERKSEPEIRIARWCIARTYRSLGRIDEALAMQKELLKEIEEKNAKQDGYVYEEIAECLLLSNDPEAAKYFGLAYELLSQDTFMAKNEKSRLDRMKELSGK